MATQRHGKEPGKQRWNHRHSSSGKMFRRITGVHTEIKYNTNPNSIFQRMHVTASLTYPRFTRTSKCLLKVLARVSWALVCCSCKQVTGILSQI